MMVHPREARLVFFGTGDFAVPSFVRLIEEGFRVCLLVTQPERPQGRHQEQKPARIKLEALQRGIPILQPTNVNEPSFV
jgi:methionyl-tRNA formyltransferase